ncbi:MAG TPA: winged helix-turn-helix domain-containing protein [Candidatus Eisenbacteria bacterium]|nr:winged helix-turn-helix domain-containing protein [Candidatus Eisenbacteria bacterium]
MKVIDTSSPFGSSARTRVLLALRLMDESYARELSRLLEISLSSVQKALQSLERDGLVAARSAGRTRLFRVNPRQHARTELERYLERLLEPEAALRARVSALRRRTRRTGKPL